MDRTFKLASKDALEKEHHYGATKYEEFVSIINSPMEEMPEEVFQRERQSVDNGPQSREWAYAVIHCLVCQEMVDAHRSPLIFCGSCKYNTHRLEVENQKITQSNEELIKQLMHCGHDGYYNDIYYPTLEKLCKRLHVNYEKLIN